MSHPTKKLSNFVNGPINSARMEGTVYGITKILYLFMDSHEDIQAQSKCSDVRSVDIDKYLIDIFDSIGNNSTICDFFFEIKPKYILGEPSNYKEKYIIETMELFKKTFNINKERNQVMKSKIFPQVRLHYIDIRDYLINGYQNMYQMSEIMNKIKRGFTDDNITTLKQLLQINTAEITNVYNLIYANDIPIKDALPTVPPANSKYTQEEFNLRAKKLIDKIKNKYDNPQNKKIINSIINNELKKYFDIYFADAKVFDKILDNCVKKFDVSHDDRTVDLNGIMSYGISNAEYQYFYYELELYGDKMANSELAVFTFLTDLYFVRRFVDKKYITNGIIYTGISHSVNYIYILNKYFGMDITHYSFLEKTPQKLKKLIAKMDNSRELDKYVLPKKLQQCSDMSSFPKII